jgi:hypothetical protein
VNGISFEVCGTITGGGVAVRWTVVCHIWTVSAPVHETETLRAKRCSTVAIGPCIGRGRSKLAKANEHSLVKPYLIAPRSPA